MLAQPFQQCRQSHLWAFKLTGGIAGILGGLVVRKLLAN